ncbi:glycoside hydrolase family 10 protein [Anabaena sp. UHCC 0399]|uniref:glycoside hydrolase family 10 protein n=1 Tax=Anabaena sp. UHCC 0399 TaxID=3110238 RepID=UPI002B1E9175|nr:family 10 glycosylhydrolase [Anabaena sp. UHCC 0399]MEA5568275.1 family 10 glycosylhydrolase [Anabaena sp. UHCC 0399]
MKNQGLVNKKTTKLVLKNHGFFIFTAQFIIVNCLNILSVKAATPAPVLSVVQSPENTQHWIGITKRLQTIGVPYCVLPLERVKSAADWGDRQVLFLPNIETLTPAQAIALEAWTNKGGNLIASGAIGSLSTPGVRQLLKNLLGSYWGFSLKDKQQLKPSKTQLPAWINQKGIFGQVHGGVLVPNDGASKAVAVWNSQDNPAAVVTTERSTLLGWRWGTDAASSAELDTAWLQVALNRHISIPANGNQNITESAPNCPAPIAKTPSTSPTSPTDTINRASTTKQDEAIDQLEQTVRWDVVPNSHEPINPGEAAAMQQQLENLIGRVESAHLAALANAPSSDVSQSVKGEDRQLATTRLVTPIPNQEQVLTQARVVANNLPRLITNKNYALARQQWLVARNNLWKQFPVDRRLAPAEIRAVWLDRGTIVRAGGEQGLSKVFDRLAQSGINTVFFEAVNAGYPIYPSQVAPQQNPLIRDWDPLAVGVKLAHERGMELHAWVWTFAVGNQRHNELLNINSDYPGPVLAAHPDWANYDNQGKIIPVGQTKPFLDPANPEVRQYLLKLYEEIVTRYKVDGLQLDYIRYPFQDPAAGRTYGYGQAARAQFQKLTGVDPVNITPSQPQLWQQWTAFRTQQVDSFVTEVSQMMRQKRSHLILSVAVFPLPESERIQKLQQHWEVWARRGDIDLIIPMTYAQDTVRFQQLAQPWIASTQLGSTLLIPGIRLLSLPTLGTFDQLQLVRDLPVGGYALFAAENVNNELHKLFVNTQGKLGTVIDEPIPHRDPLQSAVTRYNSLQREWRLVLHQEKLQISPKVISDFHSQAEILQNALTQLATSPSPRKMLVAKSTLTRFQSQFRVWTREKNISNSYQVKAWESRLFTIERLLRYGERRLELNSQQRTNQSPKF